MLNKRRNTECEFLYYVEVSLCEHWEVKYQNGINTREQQRLELFRWKHAKGSGNNGNVPKERSVPATE